MKKILFSLMAIALVVGLVGAGAFAYFNDTETSTGNTFTAGTLNLKVGNPDPTTWSCTIEDIKPGQTGTIDVELVVEGTMSGMFDAKIINVANSPGVTTEPEGAVEDDEGELGDYLLLKCLHLDGSGGCEGTPFYLISSDIAGSGGTLNFANDKWLYEDGVVCDGFKVEPAVTLFPGIYAFAIGWELPMGTGNVVQDDEVTFDIEFVLIQGDSEVSPKP